MVLVGLYVPPPISMRLLDQLLEKMVTYSTDNVFIFGDFNMVPCSDMDRLSLMADTPTELAAWAEASNFTHVWRWRHPFTRAYTCHSATYRNFSHIDLVYAGGLSCPESETSQFCQAAFLTIHRWLYSSVYSPLRQTVWGSFPGFGCPT